LQELVENVKVQNNSVFFIEDSATAEQQFHVYDSDDGFRDQKQAQRYPQDKDVREEDYQGKPY
jgi:hypothetical protein